MKSNIILWGFTCHWSSRTPQTNQMSKLEFKLGLTRLLLLKTHFLARKLYRSVKFPFLAAVPIGYFLPLFSRRHGHYCEGKSPVQNKGCHHFQSPPPKDWK